ncbi:hypothetical protein ISF_07220 [Cordyceps fumosorosea ARSEF 2679]|uniref:Uncharacterized protein n=1 Tax=Cordyceps fumosorosea (strain ARSEF 2679) TaxID=1081104 RepID=A0A167Q513_CORFA|nr:hypothetical protein ISF_07220 [Cordyceps fumosorosea ARSEF 2679]OAA57299.1 hypothetical protein ISF_07220 [Cordyceps fumosorosea ARSEF 2679]
MLRWKGKEHTCDTTTAPQIAHNACEIHNERGQRPRPLIGSVFAAQETLRNRRYLGQDLARLLHRHRHRRPGCAGVLLLVPVLPSQSAAAASETQ